MELSIFLSKPTLRIATEMVEVIRYTQITFGIPIDETDKFFCYNKLVVMNPIIPTYNLKKIHNAICYHQVREAQAYGIIQVGWIEDIRNLDDSFTKTKIYIPKI